MHIGDQVKVKVLSVRGNQVRLGIDAPREIKVNRDEVVNPRIKEERTALRPAPDEASRSATPISSASEAQVEPSSSVNESESSSSDEPEQSSKDE